MNDSHHDFGVVVLGDTLYGFFVTTNSSGTPTAADSTPTATVMEYDLSAALGVTPTVAAVAAGGTGAYKLSFAASAGNGFAAGKTYHGRIDFAISSFSKAYTFSFQVA